MLPSSPGLPDREQACRGSEPRPGPAAATWQHRWKPPCGYAQTVTETRRTAAVEGSRQARLCALPPRLLPPPAGLPPHPPPQLCSCRGRGSGACGAGSGGLPSPPRLLLGGGGPGAEQRGHREVGLPEHLWCRAPAQPPPGSVDSVTQALTGGQKWPHVLGRPCRPLPQEAQSREKSASRRAGCQVTAAAGPGTGGWGQRVGGK